MLDPRLLEIDVDLECDFGCDRLRFRSDGDRKLICELPNAETFFALKRIATKSTSLRSFGRWLNLIDQTVDVLIAGKLIARFGRDANSRLLGLLGVPSTEFKLWKLFTLTIKK